ncbi:hypothetical protein TorRG33x02_128290 [Trema orientale]|uniref:Transmembrane protein n=1 Tax=Trema orientale TaxID=63057 RepID=A0A2P5F0E2_TREOI|nr:hypothetical protein TorRG33x02_128290 [Trema orientale]
MVRRLPREEIKKERRKGKAKSTNLTARLLLSLSFFSLLSSPLLFVLFYFWGRAVTDDRLGPSPSLSVGPTTQESPTHLYHVSDLGKATMLTLYPFGTESLA